MSAPAAPAAGASTGTGESTARAPGASSPYRVLDEVASRTGGRR